MTLSLTWHKRDYNLSDTWAEVMDDLINTVFPTLLTHWELLPGVTFDAAVGGDGKAGAAFRRIDDGRHFMLWYRHNTAVIDELFGAVLSGDVLDGGDLQATSSYNFYAAVDTALGFSSKAAIIGVNAVGVVILNPATISGVFERGETITINGTYTAAVIEFDPLTGYLWIGPWISPPPGTSTAALNSTLSAKSVSGGTSGATATTITYSASSFNARYPAAQGFKFAANNEYFLDTIIGGPPSGALTGATSGVTATVSAFDANIAKLTVTGATARFRLGETITWAGGSAVITGLPYKCQRLGASLRETSAPALNGVPVLIGEDERRLVILLPQPIFEGYIAVLFGEWADSAEGNGMIDLAGFIRAWSINSNPLGMRAAAIDATTQPFAFGFWEDVGHSLPVFATILQAIQAPSTQQSYWYSDPQLDARFTTPRNLRVLVSDPSSTNIFGRLIATMPFFFWAPKAAWRSVFDPGGSQPYGLQLAEDYGFCIDFDDNSIVP